MSRTLKTHLKAAASTAAVFGLFWLVTKYPAEFVVYGVAVGVVGVVYAAAWAFFDNGDK